MIAFFKKCWKKIINNTIKILLGVIVGVITGILLFYISQWISQNDSQPSTPPNTISPTVMEDTSDSISINHDPQRSDITTDINQEERNNDSFSNQRKITPDDDSLENANGEFYYDVSFILHPFKVSHLKGVQYNVFTQKILDLGMFNGFIYVGM